MVLKQRKREKRAPSRDIAAQSDESDDTIVGLIPLDTLLSAMAWITSTCPGSPQVGRTETTPCMADFWRIFYVFK